MQQPAVAQVVFVRGKLAEVGLIVVFLRCHCFAIGGE